MPEDESITAILSPVNLARGNEFSINSSQDLPRCPMHLVQICETTALSCDSSIPGTRPHESVMTPECSRPEMLRAAARYFPTELLSRLGPRAVFAPQSPVSGSGVGFGAGVGFASCANFARVLGSSTQTEYFTSVAVARSNSATAAL